MNLPGLLFTKPEIEIQDRVATLQHGISSTEKLMDELVRALDLPWYFGRNWNALDEVLRDLSWIPERRVFLVHPDLPKLSTNDLTTYLSVLSDSAQHWARGGGHELTPVFAESSRALIAAQLSGVAAS